jgi:DNA invertase Pin-like site-specific DNA recombinase
LRPDPGRPRIIHTSSPGSSQRLHLSHDKFERTLIRARSGEGREGAKARGVRFGRPKKLSVHQRREAIERIAAGEAVAELARTFGVDRATVYRLDRRRSSRSEPFAC